MHLHTLFLSSLTYWKPLGYAIVFFGMIFEGEAILFAAAFLTHQGFFSFTPTTLIVFTGTFLADMLWYWVGKKFKAPTYLLGKWVERLASPLDEHLQKRTKRTIFVSKFTYGLHHIMLMRSGALNIPLKEYLPDAFLATIPWIIIIGFLGFASSASLFFIRRYLRFVEVGLFIMLLIFIVLWNSVIAPLLKKRL